MLSSALEQLKDLAFLFVPGDPLAVKVLKVPAGWVILAAGFALARLV